MKIKKVVPALALVLILGAVIGLLTSYKFIIGWDHSIDPHYTPEYPVQEVYASKVTAIMLEQYGVNGQHITLQYYPDGAAQYYGEILPLFRHDMHGQFRTGRYLGRTKEFPHLASWILSHGFQHVTDPCPERKGYDASITVIFNGRKISRTTCGSYKGYNWFHPIELTQTAIHDVASRINWQKMQK